MEILSIIGFISIYVLASYISVKWMDFLLDTENDSQDIFFYLAGGIAFIPFAIIVTIIYPIIYFINLREEIEELKDRIKKLNKPKTKKK